MPTLDEAFAAFPDARFNIELKAAAAELADAVVHAVEHHERAGRTLLTAGDDATMAQLRSRLARATQPPAVGACNADILAVLRAANRGETPPRDAMALQVPTAFGGRPIVTRALLDCAHAADIQVHVWTINDPAEIASLLEAGVDGIVTAQLSYFFRQINLNDFSPNKNIFRNF